MSKSQKKKNNLPLCSFHSICKGFYEDSFTCTHRGGNFCGTYRRYTREAEILIEKGRVK